MSYTIFQKQFKMPWKGASWPGSWLQHCRQMVLLHSHASSAAPRHQQEQSAVSSYLQHCPALQSDSLEWHLPPQQI